MKYTILYTPNEKVTIKEYDHTVADLTFDLELQTLAFF